jgi:hypothetical protein
MPASTQKIPLLPVLLFSAALVYVAGLKRYPLGIAIDDALYVLASRSLLSGSYLNLQLPSLPALTDPLPGFPFFLAPWVALVQPHWAVLKVVPLVLTLFAGWGVWRLTEGWAQDGIRAASTALFLFNPTTVHISTVVVSEPLFLALAFGIWISWDRWTRTQTPSRCVALGLLVGWAALSRPQGVVLMPAIAIALWIVRRKRALTIVSATALILWGAILARNWIVSQNLSGYGEHWRATLPYLAAHPSLLAANATAVTRTLFLENLLALRPEATEGWRGVFRIVIFFSAVGLTWRGLKRFASDVALTPSRRAMAIGVGVFVFCYYGIHLFWAAIDVHYLYPLLPFLLILICIAGVYSIPRNRHGGAICSALWVLLLGRYLYCDAATLRPGLPSNAVPEATYAWMKGHLPANAFVYTPAAPTVRLYSDHFTMYALPGNDVESFRYRLMKTGITHVLAQPLTLLSFSVYHTSAFDSNARWARTQRWLAAWPAAFPEAYRDAAEGTVVYQLANDPTYLDAFDSYRRSFDAMERQDRKEAIALLRQAVDRRPDVPAFQNAYGGLLLAGGELAKADRAFRRAIAARPDYPVALLNLARVYRQRNQPKEALAWARSAQDAVARTGDNRSLLPVIQEEIAADSL